MKALCPFVDDVVDEARAVANQLRLAGVPFDIRPMPPARTTAATYRLITAARPRAVLVDYYLTGRQNTDSQDLASRLLDHRVPTVILTKDRDVADQGTIRCNGYSVPVFYKRRLISDKPYVASLIQKLGGALPADGEADPNVRLASLQDKQLRGDISRGERSELHILLARLRLEETEEADRIERAQTGIRERVGSLVTLIREVTHELDDEMRAKRAVRAKHRRS